MIKQEILDELITFTDEEIDNLNKKHKIDKSIYMHENSNVIDYRKLHDEDRLFSVRKHARFAQYPMHRHNYIELSYVYSGSMTHVISGKKITIQQGELILLNQNVEHEILFTGEDDIIFNFIIQPEFLEFLSSIVDTDNEVVRFIFQALYSYDDTKEFLVFHESNNLVALDYIELIISELYRPQLNAGVSLKLLVGLLLTELMNHPENIQTHKSESSERVLMSRILKYVHTKYKEGSLVVLSKQLGIADYKICKVIKKYTKSTFIQLVQEERLKNAVQLLVSTTLPVVDIMEEVGYENITYFYKIFKKKYQMTPSVYRETYKKEIK
ncbi:AraC-like DNA-binding protein [Breznakia blatticola]|uniref:AraC-like DNA-binding protein n=1 Tax=Breznakia blatticola TaxID=1754012 RepID=A0A4R7ZRK9_9FIRM|nr:AraC family transcriptional regulator [Breznakia blatticola]TDW20603.1 AraC-like DNA-binding protein [Breznakia blatticola]